MKRPNRKRLQYRVVKVIRPQRTQLHKPVFIVGCGRSGTTILGRVLGKHPQITYLNEPRDIWLHEPRTDIWTAQAGQRSGKLHLTAADVNADNAKQIIDAFAYRVYKQGNRQLVEKLPINSFRIGFIRAIFPDARFIHLIRHGVAVAQSIERETQKYDWFGAGDYKWHLLAGYARSKALGDLVQQAKNDMLLRGLLEWRLSVSTVLQALDAVPDSDKITIRYEQLIEQPDAIIKQLEAFIGVDADIATENFARETIKNNKKDRQITSDMRAIAGELLVKLGYETS